MPPRAKRKKPATCRKPAVRRAAKKPTARRPRKPVARRPRSVARRGKWPPGYRPIPCTIKPNDLPTAPRHGTFTFPARVLEPGRLVFRSNPSGHGLPEAKAVWFGCLTPKLATGGGQECAAYTPERPLVLVDLLNPKTLEWFSAHLGEGDVQIFRAATGYGISGIAGPDGLPLYKPKPLKRVALYFGPLGDKPGEPLLQRLAKIVHRTTGHAGWIIPRGRKTAAGKDVGLSVVLFGDVARDHMRRVGDCNGVLIKGS